jgi:hypothetical protein
MSLSFYAQVFVGCDATSEGTFTVVPYSELNDDADSTGSGADDDYYDEE